MIRRVFGCFRDDFPSILVRFSFPQRYMFLQRCPLPAHHEKIRFLQRHQKSTKSRIFKDRKIWKPSKSIPDDSKWCQTTRNVTRVIFLVIWNHLESSGVDFGGFQNFRSLKILIFDDLTIWWFDDFIAILTTIWKIYFYLTDASEWKEKSENHKNHQNSFFLCLNHRGKSLKKS